jgi:hypothetical protein
LSNSVNTRTPSLPDGRIGKYAYNSGRALTNVAAAGNIVAKAFPYQNKVRHCYRLPLRRWKRNEPMTFRLGDRVQLADDFGRIVDIDPDDRNELLVLSTVLNLP